MGIFASRIHSSSDNKVYNVLPVGEFPTVVFQRVIKPNSVPGTMYYFRDGKVKWRSSAEGGFNSAQTSYSGCIFTVPEDFDFSKMSQEDPSYVMEYTRSAENANLNTTSPNYIIRGGRIICIKKLDIRDAEHPEYCNNYRVLRIHGKKFLVRFYRSCGLLEGEYNEDTEEYKQNGLGGKRVRHRLFKGNYSGTDFVEFDTNIHHSTARNLPSNFTIIPVGRNKRFKSVYQYKIKKYRKKCEWDGEIVRELKLI